MTQNREAPAYQEYAATVMAQIAYRTMTLQERGLLYSMRLECWVNGKLPERPAILAKVLGFSEQDITSSLPAVMPFFAVSEGFIVCPELEDYRKHLLEQKEKKRNGGRLGATITNKKRKPSKKRIDTGIVAYPLTISADNTATNSQLPRRVKIDSLVKQSPVQSSQNQSLEKEIIDDPWVSEYDANSKEIRNYDHYNS